MRARAHWTGEEVKPEKVYPENWNEWDEDDILEEEKQSVAVGGGSLGWVRGFTLADWMGTHAR